MNIITDFLSFRKQQIVLKRQTIHGTLSFLIHINDRSGNLSTTAKLFGDDTSFFSIVQNINTSANHLNIYLRKITNWTFQRKMSFNIDPSKQAHEVKRHKIQKTWCFKRHISTICHSNKSLHKSMILGTKLILNNILKMNYVKLVKLLGHCGNCKTFC